MSKFVYELNTDEDRVLLHMIQFFDDVGLPDHIDEDAFDSLSEKFFANNENYDPDRRNW